MTLTERLARKTLSPFLRRELCFVLLMFFTCWPTSQAGDQMSVEDLGQEDFGRVEVVHRPHGEPGDKSPGLPQAPGWPQPIAVGGWVDTKGVAFADLDEDGKLEIIAGTSGSRVYVWDYLGNPKPGWPQVLGGTASWGVAVGDVNGDGTLDIAVTAYAPVGRVYVFDRDGNLLPGWPISFGDNRACLCPTLSDLDGDGRLEIIVGERSYSMSYAHVFRYDGTEFPGNWPFALDHYPGTGAAVGDIDNDGEKEIIYCSLQTIYALESDGSIMPGWPYTAPTLAFYQNAPALADFEGDGYVEIVCSGTEWNRFFVMDHQGNFLPGWPRPAPRSGGPPSVGDVDQDGDLDIAIGNYPPSYPGVVFHVLDIEANCLPGFPLTLYGGAEGPVSIADFDGDSTMELIFENSIAVDSIGFLQACYSDADTLVPGWPLRPWGSTYLNGSTVGDVNDDGILEVSTKSKLFAWGYVNLWSLPRSYGKTRIEWGTYHFDNHRTGLYQSRSPNQPPEHFGLISPDSGAVASLKPTLFWNEATNPDAIGGPVAYTLKYSLNPLFWGYEQIEGLTGTVCTLSGLMPDSVYYWRVKADDGAPDGVTWPDQGFWWFKAASYVFGDANGDETVDPGDIVYLINYLFRNGDPPDPLLLGDANNDCVVDAADVIYLVNFLFRGGPAPLEGCA